MAERAVDDYGLGHWKGVSERKRGNKKMNPFSVFADISFALVFYKNTRIVCERERRQKFCWCETRQYTHFPSHR